MVLIIALQVRNNGPRLVKTKLWTGTFCQCFRCQYQGVRALDSATI